MKSALIKDLYSEIDRLKQGCLLLPRALSLSTHFVFVWNNAILFSVINGMTFFFPSTVQLEVYAAREKNGIYIPRDRYLHEEAEKKVQVFTI